MATLVLHTLFSRLTPPVVRFISMCSTSLHRRQPATWPPDHMTEQSRICANLNTPPWGRTTPATGAGFDTSAEKQGNNRNEISFFARWFVLWTARIRPEQPVHTVFDHRNNAKESLSSSSENDCFHPDPGACQSRFLRARHDTVDDLITGKVRLVIHVAALEHVTRGHTAIR